MRVVKKNFMTFTVICLTIGTLWFTNRVVEQAAKDFILIKVDLTRKGNSLHEKLLKKYHVKGVPTVVFLDRKGNEIKELRLVDFEPPGLFLKRMNKAKQTR